MKRFIFSALILIILLTALTGCGGDNSTAYKDGRYKAIASKPDEYGWTDFVEITISGGTIKEVVYDAVNEDNELKTEDEEYKAAMESAGSDTYPETFTKQLEDDLLEVKDASEVEIVAGATIASNSFKKLANELLSKNAIDGDTDVLSVE